MAIKNTFKKEERLCSKKQISLLFNSGSSFLVYPFLVTYIKTNEELAYPAQVMIAVSKKKFKHSVQRNLIKRKIKEAYRLSKATSLYPLLQQQNIKVILSINYISKEIIDYNAIDSKMKMLFVKLFKELKSND